MHTFLNNQRGVGHVGVIGIILVVLAVAGVGWWVWDKNQNDSSSNKALQEALKNADCDNKDKDICKFFASQKATEYYIVNTSGKIGGKTLSMTTQTEGNDKSYVKVSGETPYEIITIDDTMYTKAGDTWYKQSLDSPDYKTYDDLKVDYAELDNPNITYKKLGTEQCGDHTCFTYQVVDAKNPDTTQYRWFDTKEYRLRKSEITDKDGNTYVSTFSYEKVNIKEPSPVKELGPNQYIVPGQSQPVDLPASGDTPSEEELQNVMDQYQ